MSNKSPSTFKEWTHWLELKSQMPVTTPGLEKTKLALKQAGITQNIDPNKVILIAGTNGKGSTAKILEQLLVSAGQNVGLYTSPHLVSTCERIRTGNEMISEKDFVGLCEKHKDLIQSLELTHFESLTLFAADYFQSKKLDWMIFEVGLGGTWDATNAIDHHYSIITPIDLDHQNILGDSLAEIADNKFGIIQSGNRVFHTSFNKVLTKQLKEKLLQHQAMSTCVTKADSYIQQTTAQPMYGLRTPWGDTLISLLGQRACDNALMALTVFEGLGFNPGDHISELQALQWPARMSPVHRDSPCPIFLSGDHNQQGLESLCEILNHWNYNTLHILLGVSKDRPIKDYVTQLKTLSDCQISLTKPKFMGADPKIDNYTFYENGPLGLEALIKQAQPGDLIVITGSLYLCGDILQSK